MQALRVQDRSSEGHSGMKLKIFLIFSLMVTGCSTLETVVTENNRNTFTVDKDYQESYRILVSNFERCYAPSAIKSNIFTDNKTARVYFSSEGALAGDVHDLSVIDDSKTRIEYYPSKCLICTPERTQRHIERLKGWINKGKTDC